jgi:hypothetical protein
LLIAGVTGVAAGVIGIVAYLIFKSASSAASAVAANGEAPAPKPKAAGPKSAWTMNYDNSLAWKGKARVNTVQKSGINEDLIQLDA